MDKNIKIYTYPDVPKDGMADDEIVLKLTPWGSFTDCYAIDLCEGNKYSLRIKTGVAPRSHSELFDYFAKRRLSLDWEQDVDGNDEGVEIWGNSTLLVTYPYHIDEITTLSEAINYLMDMEEL
jgi:hypothetical protein